MKRELTILSIGLLMIQCQENDPKPSTVTIDSASPLNQLNTGWIIPTDEVFDGGPGKDGIPSIDNPQFGTLTQVAQDIDRSDLVIIVRVNGKYRMYPHDILDYHEIVNDSFDDETYLAITYCPLTGTAIGWDREVDGTVTTFGVSGLLYNSNLMPYDRFTDSYWSQMLNSGVQGLRSSVEINRYPVVEMKWEKARSQFPSAEILTRETSFSRPYNVYPYGRYRSVEDLLFPVQNTDDRIFAKERVHGIQISGATRVYQLEHFVDQSVLVDEFQGQEIILFGDNDAGYVVSYRNKELNGEKLVFQSFDNGTNGVIATDQFENQWTVFGEAISGPNEGEQLSATPSYMGFYFAWVAFNENVEIFSP